MSDTLRAEPSTASSNATGPTLSSTWLGVSGTPMTDELVDWPPDVFAFANVILSRSEAFRFTLSAGDESPPHRYQDWALLTLHALADEACAGLGVALDTSDAAACVYRARGRELLARTGSMSRVDPRLLQVLPKVRTPPTGRPAFSR